MRILQRHLLLHIPDLIHPLTVILLRQLPVDLLQYFLQISDNRTGNTDILVDLSRIDIDVQDLCIRCKGLRIGDHTIRKSGAESDQKITFAHADIGGLGTVHTDHTGIVVCRTVISALAHQTVAYRSIHLLYKLSQFRRSTGDDRTTAHIDERALGSLQQFQCIIDIGIRITLRLWNQIRFFFLIFTLCSGHILGNIYQHRPGSSALCDRKRLADGVGQFGHILYNETMLGDRHRHPGDIHFLESILAQPGKGYICRDRYQRNTVHIRCSDTGYQVGRSRSGSCHTYTHFAGRSRITVCRVCRALLMTGQHMVDLIGMLIQLIINIQDRTARITEYSIHALLFQAFDHDLGSGQQFCPCLFLPSSSARLTCRCLGFLCRCGLRRFGCLYDSCLLCCILRRASAALGCLGRFRSRLCFSSSHSPVPSFLSALFNSFPVPAGLHRGYRWSPVHGSVPDNRSGAAPSAAILHGVLPVLHPKPSFPVCYSGYRWK